MVFLPCPAFDAVVVLRNAETLVDNPRLSRRADVVTQERRRVHIGAAVRAELGGFRRGIGVFAIDK
jgi:hypothetical protein